MRILSSILALVALTGCSPLALLNAVVPHDTFATHRAIAYRDGERGKLDVYVPKDGVAAHPVIVFFYGGAWNSGERGSYLFVAEALASRGFVVVIPDYRVYPEVRYPAFVEDAATAVAWTRREIGRFGGDTRRLFVMGHSAGAHIAAMVAYNPRFLAREGLKRSDLRGFIGIAGPYDFTPSEPDVLGALSGEGGTEDAMPARYVEGGEPPSLLIVGDEDKRVGVENLNRLVSRLKAVGSPYEERHFADLNHSTVIARLAKPIRDDALLDAIADFAKR